MKRIFAALVALVVAGCNQQNSGNSPGASGQSDPTSSAQSREPVAAETKKVPYHVRPLGTTGSDWRIINVTGTRPSRLVELMDFKSLVVSGDNRHVWLARVKEDRGNISYSVLLYEYNCKNKTLINKKIGYTNGRDDILDVIDADEKVEYVIPGTIGHSDLQYACGTLTAKKTIPHGVDPIFYIKDQFLVITKGEFSRTLDELLMREQNTLPVSEAVKIGNLFEKIASRGKDKKTIDVRTERLMMSIHVDKNITSKSIKQELDHRFRFTEE